MRSYEEFNRQEFPPLGTLSVWFGVFLCLIAAGAQPLADGTDPVQPNPFVTTLQLPLIALILGSLFYFVIQVNRSLKWPGIPRW